MSERLFVGHTLNGRPVSFDPEASHAATHIQEQHGLLGLVKEALAHYDVPGADTKIEHDFQRPIGEMDLIEVQPHHLVFYAIRRNRETYTPFVEAAERPAATTIVMILTELQQRPAELNLLSAYIGRITPSLPGDPRETPDSLDFWTKHALVLGNQQIDPVTRTADCPWPIVARR